MYHFNKDAQLKSDNSKIYTMECLADWPSEPLTLIWFAKFSAKTVSMPKLLQNNSNLNDFEYSRHLKARKIEKRPKKF